MNSVKDVPRGKANCHVLGEGHSPADHRHHKRATPLDTKRKEIAEGLQYAAIDKRREKSTSAKRRNKDTRPL